MSRPPEAGQTDAQTGLLPSFARHLPGERPRMLFVHAHPDDESIATGATMAGYAAAGADVVLLTCTRGEMGEVIPEELRHLEVGNPACRDNGEALAELRTAELAEAVAALGISRQVFLGDGDALAPGRSPVRYRDSGMVWGESGRAEAGESIDPGAFVAADLDAAAVNAAQLISTFRPHAVITYDDDGGYGHPDHIRAHELTHAALTAAADRWSVPWVYSIHSDWEGATPAGRRPQVTISGDLDRKRAAMRAHHTQIVIDDGQFALSNGIWQPLLAAEVFLLEERSLIRDGTGPVDGQPVAPANVPPSESWTADGKPAKRDLDDKPSTLAGIGGALSAALIATVFGTALHAQILYLPWAAVPWGAFAALVLVGCVATVAGLWARNVWMTVLTGVVTYVLVGLISTGSRVIIADFAQGIVLPVAVAGIIWIVGIAVATIVAAIVCLRSLKASGFRTPS
ncbi:MAG TPA: PIG-L family deacetylase [Arthrobacter sp.]|nr:PIG-L family deacetylase [Arthrobacter sp.]